MIEMADWELGFVEQPLDGMAPLSAVAAIDVQFDPHVTLKSSVNQSSEKVFT